MRQALSLARRNLGQTWPNPSVGALVVKDGQVISQGITAKGGRPHAETQALAQAGELAKNATLFVTLEPCCHHGQTPPCVDAIRAAGIAKVVVACRDPNPLMSGKGIGELRQAGLEVMEGVCEKEALEMNRGFFSVIEKKRPYIALKVATSLDGKITYASSSSNAPRAFGDLVPQQHQIPASAMPREDDKQWITGAQARSYGHLLRSRYDAIATGIGTVLADDPLLTCRLPGLEGRSPVRVVFDRQKRLPKDSKLAKTAKEVPLWLMDSPVEEAVKSLAEKGITRLLVEAGQGLSTAFLNSGLVDRIYWFRAPVVIGEGGLAAFDSGMGLARWRCVNHIALQPDTLDILECSPA